MKRGRLNSRRKAFALALAVVAVLGINAISASGAQALTWQRGTGTHVTKILSGAETESIAGTGSFTISSTVLGEPSTVECGASNNGSIGANGSGSATISLTGCVVVAPSHCEITSAPTLKANTELVEVGGKLFQKFTPVNEKEKTFGYIEYRGAECPFNRLNLPLKGTFAGAESSTALSVTHTLVFTKSEPWPAVEPKFGGTATISGQLVGQHLSGGLTNRPWRPLWQTTHGAWEVEWEVGGSPLGSAEAASVTGGPVSFNVSLLGNPISFTCSEPRAKGAVLKPGNTESVESLSFAGCKVAEPSTCAVPNNKIQTSPVTGTLVSVSGKTYEKFVSESGVLMGWDFAGSACPVVGLHWEVSGSIVALGPNLGLLGKVQPFVFSKAADEAAAGGLSAGSAKVTMGGSLEQALAGPLFGVPWGAY
jgi:hypothetical protein